MDRTLPRWLLVLLIDWLIIQYWRKMDRESSLGGWSLCVPMKVWRAAGCVKPGGRCQSTQVSFTVICDEIVASHRWCPSRQHLLNFYLRRNLQWFTSLKRLPALSGYRSLDMLTLSNYTQTWKSVQSPKQHANRMGRTAFRKSVQSVQIKAKHHVDATFKVV